MTERIKKLTELTLKGETYSHQKESNCEREDIFLEREERESKRICEALEKHEPILTPYSKFTGYFNSNGSSYPGNVFHRWGHKNFQELADQFYLKAVDNLVTFEWQHATADYKQVLKFGLSGLVEKIEQSLVVHEDEQEKRYLRGLKKVALGLIAWTKRCSNLALEYAKTVENEEYRLNLETLAYTLSRVPENPPKTFYEAVLTIYVCFSADPDSVGTLDRYLNEFYERDIQNGTLTREEAKEYLQELFLMIQSSTHFQSPHFTRGGQSHFSIGGYLADGRDGFNDFCKLILESLIDLPTYIPQVTVRWTTKMKREDFRFVLDCERKDAHKRIAFQNDEKRLKCYTEICGFPFEKAIEYTTVGCNEPTFLGVPAGSCTKVNFLKSVTTIFNAKAERCLSARDFETFYQIYLQELLSDLDRALAYDDKFNDIKSKDNEYLSSLFCNSCIDKAKSVTKGAGEIAVCSPECLGITNVIDSLIVVKQFVFDEKVVPMSELIKALQANWVGYEDLRTMILKKGDFFGNDTERSNYIAQKLYQDLYEYLKDKKNLFGYPFVIGDILGYNEHHKWFGEKTKATPDGRCDGDLLKFGLGQSEGKDRNGLTALLNSVAKIDPSGIACGSTVTNVTIDEQLIKNDENFEKTVDMFETYFKKGGVHFQLTYVSKEDLISAKKTPEEYKNLRVRVSGFSDYFVKLNNALQDDIIDRTEHKK